MTKLLLLALALVFVAAPAAAGERRYTVTQFDRILVEGPYAVTLATGRAPTAVATGDSAALERVSIEVQGRTLKVRPNRSAWGGYPGQATGPIAVQVGTHELVAAVLTGGGSLAIDKARAMRFDLALSGSGRLSLGAVEADLLTIGLAGSGTIKIGGKAKTLRATIQGSGNLDGDALLSEDAQVDAATSGAAVLGVRRTAKISSSGAGNIEILGDPACTVSAKGAGLVLCGG